MAKASFRRGNLISRIVCGLLAALACSVGSPGAPAQVTAPTAYSFGTVTLGSTASETVTFNFTASTAVSTVSILMQGATGKDFIALSPDSSTTLCTAKTYAASSSCTVDVVFSPLAIGQRLGAVVLADSGGNALQTEYISGYGKGAVIGYGSQTVTTVAGNGTVKPFSANSSPLLAGIGAVSQVALDGNGNMYIAGTYNGTLGAYIWKLTPGGVLSQFAGTGGTCSATNQQAGTCAPFTSSTSPATTTSPLSVQINEAFGIAVDALGNVWWVDPSSDQLFKENAAGTTVERVTNNVVSGTPVTSGNLYSNVNISLPTALTFDGAGNLYIAIDQQENGTRPLYVCVLKVAPDGTITNIAGNPAVAGGAYSGNGGPATSAVLGYIQGMSFDPSGNLYLADDENNQVYRVDISGNIHLFAGTGGSTDNTSSLPVWGGTTTSTTLATSLQIVPYGVASDAAGNIYISNGATGSAAGSSNRILLVTPAGYAYIYAGAGSSGESNGTLSASTFSRPWGLTFDGQGNLYVADFRTGTNTSSTGGNVRKVGPSGGSSASLTFPTTTNVGSSDTTDNPQSVTLLNVGDATLTLSTPSTGKNPTVASGFSVDATSTCPSPSATPTFTLAVNASCIFAIDFAPLSNGTDSGSLSLLGNLPGGTSSISLTGTGLGPTVDHFGLSGLPASATAGTAISGTVTAYSTSGTTVAATYTGPVKVTSSDTNATLPSNLTLSNGTANFNVTLKTTPSQTITAADANSGTPTVTSSSITVNAGAAASIAATGSTTISAATGAAFGTTALQVQVLDAYGNSVSGATVTYGVPSTGASATLSGSTCTTNASGICSVTATANTLPGAYSITAKAGGVSAGVTFSATNTGTANYTVTVATDTTTGTASNCTENGTNDANCSLRDALAAATALPTSSLVPVQINFSSTKFNAATTITLGNAGTLNVPTYTTVQGSTNGSGSTKTNLITVNGGGATIFTIPTSAVVTLSNLSITGATTTSGISSMGNLTVNACTVTANIAYSGGGIFAGAGQLTITNSSIFANRATVGGGITTFIPTTITNSTIANNSGVAGGGINSSSSVTLVHATITGNSASSFGGGIAQNSNGTSTTASNSIVAGNSSPTNPDASVLSMSVATSVFNASSSPLAISLAPIGSYGGPTQTMPAVPGSTALCAGSVANDGGLLIDQRGNPRSTTYGTTPCVDAGATQLGYSIGFVQQPTNVQINSSISPSPTVQLYDNGVAIALSGASVGMTAAAGTLSGTTPQSTSSTGLATFNNLSIGSIQTSDKLTASTAITSSISVTATSSSFNVGPVAVSATQAIASVTLTQSYATTSFTPVTGSGGTTPLAYSVSPTLPTGLSISSTTGAITGTPTVTSAATTYTVTVTDATSATATATFSLKVSAAVTATQSVASTSLTQNKAATSFIPVTGANGTGTLSYSISPTLPTGLSISSGTGAITGTPTTTSAATTYTVTLTDSNGATATATFSLKVNAAVTATQAVASTTLTQNYAATSFTPVTGANGTGTLSYSVSPTLPTGLSMASATGAITGTATVPSSATTYTVTVTDANGATATATFSQKVSSAVTATQAVPTTTLRQNSVATAFTPVTGGGGTGTLSYSVSPTLPTGLSFASSTGTITGTPTVPSSATTYTVTVTDANGATATATFSLTVMGSLAATQAIASTTLTQNHAASFTPVTGSGGTGTLSYGVSPTLPTGLTYSSSTGAITGTPTVTSAATIYTVTVTDTTSATAQATFSLTVNSAVTTTQAIASTLLTQNHAATSFTPVTGTGGTGTLSYGVSPTLPAGLSVSTSTGAITGTPTGTSSATTYTVTVTDANSATATATFSLTVNAAVTATQDVASTTLTQNRAATSFSPVTGSGGTTPLAYSISPTLPTGLSYSASTGAITGTPSITSAATTYTVTVTDANSATATATFSLKVNAAVTASQAVASTALTQNHAATSFTPVTGANGTTPLSYGVSPALPTGLSMASSTGAITGTPSVTSAATTYTVTVTDANSATATATFSLTVNSAVTATQAVASTTLVDNQPATAFTPVTGAGGTGTLSYSVSPALPSGLSLAASTGTISGTPTLVSSATTYTVTVTDANSATATATFSLTVILSVPPTVASVSAVSTTYGSTTGITVTATESGTLGLATGGVVTFSVTGPATGSFSPATCTITSSGTCTTTYIPSGTLTAGTYTNDITAGFAMVGSYSAASGSSTLTVNQASQTINFTPPVTPVIYGTGPYTLVATGGASGNPVTFSIVSGGAYGSLSGTNNATLTITGAGGTIVIAANQAANTNYSAATQVTQSVVVNQASQTITFAPASPVTFGVAPITLTATGGGSGNPVTYTLVSGPATLNGSTLTITGAGSVVLSANQAGNANYTAASPVSATIVVNKALPLVALVSSANPVLVQNAVTFTATLSSPAGLPANGDTVTFYDNTASATLGTGSVTAGVATYTTSSLAVGTHSITAIFTTDANFLGAPSPALIEVVQDFSLNISTAAGSVTSQTVLPGAAATYSFTLSMTNGGNFPATVALTVSGAPAGSVVTISPSTLAVGTGTTPVTLTIQTPKQQGKLEHGGSIGKGLAPIAFALLLLPFTRRLRKSAKKLSRIASLALLLLAGAGAMAGLTGCGVGEGIFAQPQQTYTVTVTGTSGALNHSTTVTLTVE